MGSIQTRRSMSRIERTEVATALTRARQARLPSPWTGRGILHGREVSKEAIAHGYQAGASGWQILHARMPARRASCGLANMRIRLRSTRAVVRQSARQ